MGEHTRSLADLRGADESLFGGKSASLGELIAAEVPVPPGFGVASTAFAASTAEAGLDAHIAGELEGLDPEDLGAVRSCSAQITEAVRSAPVPAAVGSEITSVYGSLGDGDPPVAVRSSALGEDSAEATFAGQQETYLWVRGAEAVCSAVRDCWASLYSPEAISYRARMGADRGAAMGVTVQRMVDAAVSGVMFTCNPVSGDPSSVAVNASWGLGVAVVGGEVTPDEYRVSKITGEVLHRTVGPKQIEYLPHPSGTGTLRADVPENRQQAACLDDEQLGTLVDVGRRVERHFGGHQDVEWAIARGGEGLFVLQSRPVTTVRAAPPAERRSALSLVMGTFGAGKPADGS
ncbi:MAG: pyruvate, water dikinase [Thermoleophilaceae bacterium]|nr:pyruvate, water dikinase [Thermoleophilaceae bacterium]